MILTYLLTYLNVFPLPAQGHWEISTAAQMSSLDYGLPLHVLA